jgi:hypothetical protein
MAHIDSIVFKINPYDLPLGNIAGDQGTANTGEIFLNQAKRANILSIIINSIEIQ